MPLDKTHRGAMLAQSCCSKKGLTTRAPWAVALRPQTEVPG